ncbi:hypothetical protein Poli38472_012444 [Pythium oligandrum]|uniref:Crinkler effector protein N-terminal domain-containing protein n=1 Tax=Pythium oligandrum TaxID=41045 RepID=A0A8K1CS54_PYTOL|nr:hypothetical protein Poli38472_012444 [Pythium oligandrum]|eukprot:TMW67328.1 hypothetical protein Poli38472_012444 [Pythium oligandrum]
MVMTLVCRLLDTPRACVVRLDGHETVDRLLQEIQRMEPHVEPVAVYVARYHGEWLTTDHPDVQGLSDGIERLQQKYLTRETRMNPLRTIDEYVSDDAPQDGVYHILVKLSTAEDDDKPYLNEFETTLVAVFGMMVVMLVGMLEGMDHSVFESLQLLPLVMLAVMSLMDSRDIVRALHESASCCAAASRVIRSIARLDRHTM